jgi:hypothetical protein
VAGIAVAPLLRLDRGRHCGCQSGETETAT